MKPNYKGNCTAFYECCNVIKTDIRNKMEEEYFYDCCDFIY